MPRIAVALMVVGTIGVSIGINTARFPVVWEMVGGSSTEAPPKDAAPAPVPSVSRPPEPVDLSDVAPPTTSGDLRGFDSDKGHLFHEAYYGATDYVSNTVPTLMLIRSILRGYDRLAQNGVGLIHAAEGIGFPLDMDVGLVSVIARAMAKKSDYQTRIFFQTMEVKKALKRNLPRIGGCFATALDGCFGVEDAALVEPYANNPNNKGILFYKDSQVIEFAKAAKLGGLKTEQLLVAGRPYEPAHDVLSVMLSGLTNRRKKI